MEGAATPAAAPEAAAAAAGGGGGEADAVPAPVQNRPSRRRLKTTKKEDGVDGVDDSHAGGASLVLDTSAPFLTNTSV